MAGEGTSQEVAEVRRWIGATEPPTDGQIVAQIIQAGSASLAAQWYLQARRAELLGGPSRLSVPGLSIDYSAIIKAIDDDLEALGATTGEGGEVSPVEAVQLVRADRSGR